MGDICTDNRFELIEKYKKELIESTNIESSQDEMNVLDDLLFRFWQMRWLDRLEQPERKKGKWIETDSHEPCWYKCDQCGRLHDFLDNYCPNCGADMRGEGEE